jgi:hypothetical protein
MQETNKENLVDWFEAFTRTRYPQKIKTLLDLLTNSETPIQVLFDSPRPRSNGYPVNFKVLDFKELEKVRSNPAYEPPYEEQYSNPYFIVGKIQEYIERYGPGNPYLLSGRILPFARDYDADGFRYLYFLPEKDNVFYFDLDTEDTKVDIIANNIEQLIGPIDDIIDGITQQNKKVFQFSKALQALHEQPRIDHYIDEKNVLVYDGECVDGAGDYKQVIEMILKTTNNEFALESFEATEGERRSLTLTINGSTHTFDVEGNTDWFDSKTIKEINTMLRPLMKGKQLVEVYDQRWGQEFGVVYADAPSIEVLRKNGFLQT